MAWGEKAILTVGPQYAFGDSGRDIVGQYCSVPPNATLNIDIEVLSSKQVVDVMGDSYVLKKVLREGNATLNIDIEVLSFKQVVDVMGDSYVLKMVLREGEGLDTPNDGAVVDVRCKGMLEDGTIFEKMDFDQEEDAFFIIDEGCRLVSIFFDARGAFLLSPYQSALFSPQLVLCVHLLRRSRRYSALPIPVIGRKGTGREERYDDPTKNSDLILG